MNRHRRRRPPPKGSTGRGSQGAGIIIGSADSATATANLDGRQPLAERVRAVELWILVMLDFA